MLDSLRFVQGAVAKKDFVPALTHFSIKGGRIRGYNGALALCTPIALDLDCSPKALPFIKAIQTCRETIQLHLTTAGRLSVKSGTFKALVDCTDEAYPDVEPEGEIIHCNGELLGVLRALEPFVSEDASRPWSRGVLLRGESAFATNNIVLVERWLGYTFPSALNVPLSAIKELLRIGEEPASIQISETSATFHFTEGRWLRTQSYSTEWPDLARVLNVESVQGPIPAGLWTALEDITPFADQLGRVVFHESGSVSTGHGEGAGAAVELPTITHDACFNINHLKLLEGVANTADFTLWPRPCPFFGEKIRGAIVGIRL